MAPRRRSERRTMDVKVLYSHDSAPQHTMVARLGRRTAVRVAASPITTPRGDLRLGRASPELVLDQGRDYILYAVDPAESARASPRSPARRTDGQSPSKSGTGARVQVFVGKGFFRGCLEEPGDGASYVTGRVCNDHHSSDAFSSDEDSEGGEVLEVVLRLKDAPRSSREQHDSVMRGINAQTPRADAFPPEQTAQLLHVLQALQSHSQAPLSDQQRTQLVGVLSMVAGALGNSSAASTPSMPAAALGTPTPGYSALTPAAAPAPAPAQVTSAAPVLATSAPASASHTHAPREERAQSTSKPSRICYNCGTTTSRTWRIMQLRSGTHVSYPQSERPPTDVVPMTWVPRYRSQATATADGETRWQSCNPCGLYYTKYGVSRPDHVRNFGHARHKRTETERKRTKTDDGHGRRGASSPESMLPPAPPTAAAHSSPMASTYSVPPYLMNSSPGTVMTTLMSDADLDFEEMRLRRPRTPQSPSPVRRSPRKRPHGTHSGVNPYATAQTRSTPPPPSTPSREGPSTGVLTRSQARRQAQQVSSGSLGGFLPSDDDEPAGPPSPSEARAARQAESGRTPLRELFGSFVNENNALVPARRPLPATVEDASPSSEPSELSVDDIEVFEDPYGILAASGFGPGSANPLLAAMPGGRIVGLDGVSADAFNSIELHQAPDFAQHYEAFTQGGGLGIAAHMAPQGAAAAPITDTLHGATSNGGAPSSGNIENFLDDPSVQAMLAHIGDAQRAPPVAMP
ncbi:hypothetical protein MCUN1_000220 [Malassezia cuniculi]|uniref:GATA-type domain-containing protein n=1 Tax=Malassezia cuniculi TaxID=948313 RepID=A0AAF0EQX1_9BASI|nr:hypothetical protein MCUN1_000220 [Malassezia cuniculi]